MVENGDDEVRKHLDTAPRNANYGSHVAKSENLDAISLWVQQGILRSLKEAAFYSILADESTDIATIEELSICFRWVDSSGSPVEHFLGLVSLSACDAASIFTALKAFLADSDIDAGKLRGQGYDGAATFSGTKNGVQMRIRTLAPRALFVHCRAHVLQLCCVSAARCVPSLKKVFATLMSVWKMFHYSPKKFSALKEMQALVNHPQLKMIKPSDTRWLAHDRSVKANRCSMRPLIDTLKHIHEDTGEPEALGMLRTMKTYKFVATLMMLSYILPVLTCLSRALQAKTADFTLVASQLTYVQHSLQQVKERPNDQDYLSIVHDTVTDLAIGVVDLETARENFNKDVLQPYLEEVSRQISCHFKDTLGLLIAFSIFDPQKCPTDVQQLHKYGTAELEKLLKFYGETTEIEYEGNVFSTPADVDKTETRHEWSFQIGHL